jgi:flagellar motor protein MotB
VTKRKNNCESDDGVNPNGWMGTLADLVFLLITFFVLLISMSSMDKKAIKRSFGFFSDAVGVLDFVESPETANDVLPILDPLAAFAADKNITPTNRVNDKTRQSARELLDQLAEEIAKKDKGKSNLNTLKRMMEDAAGTVVLEPGDEDMSLLLSYRLLFKDETLELNDEGLEVIRSMATIVRIWGGDVQVQAVWPWNEGPRMMSVLMNAMEEQWVEGERLRPELRSGWNRSIRFQLKRRNT